MKYLIILYSVCLLLSCREDNFILVQQLDAPFREGCCSNVFSIGERSFLTWIAFVDDSTEALMITEYTDDSWVEATEISRGSDWFTNWADFPSLVSFDSAGQILITYWLQKSSPKTFDYDIHMTVSRDGGNTWGQSFVPHKDGVRAEHGFVSMTSTGQGEVMAAWLDGRNTKSGSHEVNQDHGHGHGGPMTLRSALIGQNGEVRQSRELDNRVCDCCQTSIAGIEDGFIVVYRDRSDDEVRDIYGTRWIKGEWSDPEPVHQDNWQIGGCPVNGPVVTSMDTSVAVAWFAMVQNSPEVKLSFSDDNGQTFSDPFILSSQSPIGRVDVELINTDLAAVTWIDQKEDGAIIVLQFVDRFGAVKDSTVVAEVQSGRQSGFPRMAKMPENRLLITWTGGLDSKMVKTAIVDYNNIKGF